jgi:hypothetical protein
MLDLLANEYKIKHVRFSCGTRAEFTHRLKRSRKHGFDTLYLSFHGKKNHITLEDGHISLEEIAEIMKHRFADWHIHFGSCSTFKFNGASVRKFKRSTQAYMVTGYTKDVYWMDSVALEMGVFSYLADGERLSPSYDGLIDRTGFVKY